MKLEEGSQATWLPAILRNRHGHQNPKRLGFQNVTYAMAGQPWQFHCAYGKYSLLSDHEHSPENKHTGNSSHWTHWGPKLFVLLETHSWEMMSCVVTARWWTVPKTQCAHWQGETISKMINLFFFTVLCQGNHWWPPVARIRKQVHARIHLIPLSWVWDSRWQCIDMQLSLSFSFHKREVHTRLVKELKWSILVLLWFVVRIQQINTKLLRCCVVYIVGSNVNNKVLFVLLFSYMI